MSIRVFCVVFCSLACFLLASLSYTSSILCGRLQSFIFINILPFTDQIYIHIYIHVKNFSSVTKNRCRTTLGWLSILKVGGLQFYCLGFKERNK